MVTVHLYWETITSSLPGHLGAQCLSCLPPKSPSNHQCRYTVLLILTTWWTDIGLQAKSALLWQQMRKLTYIALRHDLDVIRIYRGCIFNLVCPFIYVCISHYVIYNIRLTPMWILMSQVNPSFIMGGGWWQEPKGYRYSKHCQYTILENLSNEPPETYFWLLSKYTISGWVL